MKTKQISNNKNDKKLIKSESEPFKKKSKKNHMVQNIQKKKRFLKKKISFYYKFKTEHSGHGIKKIYPTI